MTRPLAMALAATCVAASQSPAQLCQLRFEDSRGEVYTRHLGVLSGVAQSGLYGSPVRDHPGAELFPFARWTGSRWEEPDGFPKLLWDGSIEWSLDDFCVFDDGSGPGIYVCGSFNQNELGEPLRYVAKWNGEKWVDVGGGVNGGCRAMCVFDDGSGPALYVGGYFFEAGGAFVSNIAKWDGDVWTDVGGGVTGGNNWVEALAVFDDGAGPALFVGGMFRFAGGEETPGVAKWTGSEWVPIAERPSGAGPGSVRVLDMASYDDGTGAALYVCGTFKDIAGVRGNGILRWDGTRWSSVGEASGSSPGVWMYSVEVFNDGAGPKLYAGGIIEWFSEPAGLARWDGTRWEDISWQGGTFLLPHTMASLDTPHGQELWLSMPPSTMRAPVLGRLRCVSDSCDFADCDHTGWLDVFDFLCFQTAFAAADPEADCDGDGGLTLFDFLCFQNHFAAGCP